MKYFLYKQLRADEIYAPCDAEGRAISVLYGDRSEELGYRSVSSVTEAFLPDVKESDLRDSLYCPSSYLVISERMAYVINDSEIDAAISLLSVTVTCRDEMLRYFLLYSSASYDPINYDRSRITYYPGSTHEIRSVEKYVFARDKIPAVALFRTFRCDWVFSEILASRLLKEEFTGHSFEEVNVM